MKVLKYGKINDLPRGWVSEEEWHRVIYDMWAKMWSRVNNDPYYSNTLIQSEYRYLSKYVLAITQLDNFVLFKQNPKGWCIDKDIKGGKHYYFENLSLVPKSTNVKERNTRCRNPGYSRRKYIIAIGSTILLYKSSRDASKDGFDYSSVSKACKNKYYNTNRYKGYRWYYVNYKHKKVLRTSSKI